MSSYDINKVLKELSITTTEIYNAFQGDVLQIIDKEKSMLEKELTNTLKLISTNPKEDHEFYYGEMDKKFLTSKNYIYNYLQSAIYKIGATLNKTGMDFVNKYLVYDFDHRQLISKVIWKHQDDFDVLIPNIYNKFQTHIDSLHTNMCKSAWDNPEGFHRFLDFVSECTEEVAAEVTTSRDPFELNLMELLEEAIDKVTFSLIDYTDLTIDKLSEGEAPLENLSDKATINYALAYSLGETFKEQLMTLGNTDLESFTTKGFSLCQDFQLPSKTKEILLHNYTAKFINSLSYIVEFLTFEYCDELINTSQGSKDLSLKEYLRFFKPESSKQNEQNNLVAETPEEYMKAPALHYIASYKTLNRLAMKHDYTLHRIKGSHAIYKNSNGIIIPIPQHKIGKGLSFHIQKSILGLL